MELRPGLSVAIQGLKGASDLNGTSVTCKEWDDDKGRWIVEMPGGERKALRPENLKAPNAASKPTSETPSPLDSNPWLIGVIGIFVLMFVLSQNGAFDDKTPTAYVKSLFEPFNPPPPRAPKDTVVISFCQG